MTSAEQKSVPTRELYKLPVPRRGDVDDEASIGSRPVAVQVKTEFGKYFAGTLPLVPTR